MRNKGFSAVELLFSLTISITLLVVVISVYKMLANHSGAADIAQNAVTYSKNANRYIRTHSSLLQELLTYRGTSNGKIATVSMSVLKEEKFLPDNYPSANRLNQYPCVVITWANNQLQGFLYYREDESNTKTLTKDSLYAGLNNSGEMLGVYSDGVGTGARGGWILTSSDINDLFSQALGSVDPSQGNDPTQYTCLGSQVANNSYIVNMAMEQTLNNQLAKDDNIHLYADPQNDIDSPQNANTLNDDLNMDYKADGTPEAKSSLIFQSNPDCVMDPQDLATMQDYSTENPRGCRNKQLAIQESNSVMTINGFQQAGDVNNSEQPHPYVGELQAASFQPTAKVAIGTACTIDELGKMAQQAYDNNNLVNNIYVSQVQCMKNPLCPETTAGVCYMPIQTVTIESKTVPHSNEPTSVVCPSGMFVTSYKADTEAQKPSPCCGSNLGFKFCCWIEKCNNGRPGNSCSSVESTNFLSSKNPILYQGITTTPSHWYQGCPYGHGACYTGYNQKPDSYIQVYSITCTNDITKANFNINR